MDLNECILAECHFFDSNTGETGYEIVCFNSEHQHIPHCPKERELFRKPADQQWLEWRNARRDRELINAWQILWR